MVSQCSRCPPLVWVVFGAVGRRWDPLGSLWGGGGSRSAWESWWWGLLGGCWGDEGGLGLSEWGPLALCWLRWDLLGGRGRKFGSWSSWDITPLLQSPVALWSSLPMVETVQLPPPSKTPNPSITSWSIQVGVEDKATTVEQSPKSQHHHWAHQAILGRLNWKPPPLSRAPNPNTVIGSTKPFWVGMKMKPSPLSKIQTPTPLVGPWCWEMRKGPPPLSKTPNPNVTTGSTKPYRVGMKMKPSLQHKTL